MSGSDGVGGTGRDGAPETPREPGPVLYLVELRSTTASVGEVQQMHRALRYAVARRAAGGAAIRWTGAVLVPGEGRCLCLVEAAAASAVDGAIDSAGLRATPQRACAVLGSPARASGTHDSDDDTTRGEH